MRFYTALVLSSLAVLGLASPQAQTTSTGGTGGSGTSSGPNPFNVPSSGYSVSAGSPTTLTWTPTTSGQITIVLRDGASNALNSGVTLASDLPNSGSVTVNIPSNVPRGSSYTFEIIDQSNKDQVNFTPQFVVDSSVLSSGSSSGTSSASATGTSSASASASASTSGSSKSSSASSSASSKSSSSASASSSAAASSTAASSTSSSSSATAQTTSAPSGGAAVALKVEGGMLAIVMGAVALL